MNTLLTCPVGFLRCDAARNARPSIRPCVRRALLGLRFFICVRVYALFSPTHHFDFFIYGGLPLSLTERRRPAGALGRRLCFVTRKYVLQRTGCM